jgi:RNA polymerase sigma factor (sigma-70 family)
MDIPHAESVRNFGETESDITNLLRRAQEGSDAASQLLFDRCRLPLLAVIRHVLRPPLRRLYDSDDFLNETFVKIFTTHFTDGILRSPETLWPYLKRIAENMVRDANRKYLHSQRYNITRNRSLENLPRREHQENLWARDISPEEALLLKELVEEQLVHFINQLPMLMQRIVRLLLGGAMTSEIAEQLGIEPKRVYRAMEWLKKKIRE